MYSPFLGGGAVEKYMMENFANRLIANDIDFGLINFYRCVSKDFKMLHVEIQTLVTSVGPVLTKDVFNSLQSSLLHRSMYPSSRVNFKLGALYFLVWYTSFNHSCVKGSGLSSQRQRIHNMDAMRYIANAIPVKHAHLSCLPFHDFLMKVPKDAMLYLDPPYFTARKQYNGHKGFDHGLLRKMLQSRTSWVLSYDDCPQVRNMYKGFKIIKVAACKKSSIISSDILIMPIPYYMSLRRCNASL